ncbi:MAG: hypothetical protein ACRDCG_02190 [Mycoplasmoidaceae bacterium]
MKKFCSKNNFIKNKINASFFYNFFGIFLPYMILYILVGEIDTLNLDWLSNHSINYKLYIIIFSFVFLNFIWIFIGIFTKTILIDSFSYFFSTTIFWLSIFLTYLIPNIHINNISNKICKILWLVSRLGIIIFFTISSFFTSNFFVKKIIFNCKYLKNQFLEKVMVKSLMDKKHNDEYNSTLDIFKKNEVNEIDEVEVTVKIKE